MTGLNQISLQVLRRQRNCRVYGFGWDLSHCWLPCMLLALAQFYMDVRE